MVTLDSEEGQGALEGVHDTEKAEDVNLCVFLTAVPTSDEASMMASE